MIIQCDKCQAKFKLDDSKVTEKGAKVRCSKCKNIFIVKKEEEPVKAEPAPVPSEAPLEEEKVEEEKPAAEKVAPPVEEEKPTVEESVEEDELEKLAAAAAAVEEEKPPAEKPAEEEEKGKPSIGESAFPSFEAPFKEGKAETAGEAEAEKPAIEEEPVGEDVTWGDLEATAETSTDLSDLEGLSAGIAATEEEEAPPSSDTFGFESEGAGLGIEAGGEEGAPAFGEEAPSFGMEESTPAFGEEAPSFGMEESTPAFGEEAPVTGEEGSGFGEVDLGGEKGETGGLEIEERESPPPAPESELPPPEAAPEKMAMPAGPSKVAAPKKKAKKKSSASKVLVLLLLLLVAAGGGLYYIVTTGYNINIGGVDLQNLIKDIRGKMGVAAVEPGTVDIKDLKGYYLQTKSEGMVFIIEGSAMNNFKNPRSFIRLRGNLYDAGGKVIMKQEAYSGNVFDSNELIDSTRDKITGGMNYKMGKEMSNSNIAAGGSVPFMIVFYGTPEALAEYDVGVISSEDAL